jgi:hypothetical protein
MAVIEGVDSRNLAEAGWGIVFAYDANPAVREALTPLLAHRRAQATANSEHLYRELSGSAGVRAGESKTDFLARNGSLPGPVNPNKIPYYLLLVGSPEVIPYTFQYHLKVQHAVGRIHFVDGDGNEDLDAYEHYARGVVTAESMARSRRLTFVGVENPDDPVTAASTRELVRPLADHVVADKPDWEVSTLLGVEATKANIGRALAWPDTPSLLLASGHGIGFPFGDPRQLDQQGALLCSDWPGPRAWRGPVPEDYYFAAHDVADHERLPGMIVFLRASFGAGTPRMDDFTQRAFSTPQEIAPRSFVAALPRRLLSLRNGGILALVGPVERAWGYAVPWQQTRRESEVLASVLKRLMEGHPVGSAVEFLSERYAELATMLTAELSDVKFGKIPDDLALAGMWGAHNDARAYAIVGDPAVRLVV